MNTKSTDMMRKAVNSNNYEYILETSSCQLSPEELLIAAETAALAGEEFEAHPTVAFDLGYCTPLNEEECLTAMCRRSAISREDRILDGIGNADSDDVPRRVEDKYKRKVRRRKKVIAEELPRKTTMYNRCK